MLNRLDEALSFHQNALRIRGQRQELIAANIANADTPNFKARDIDFKAAMQSAVAGINKDAVKTTKTSPLHLDGTPLSNINISTAPGEPLFRPIIQGSVDGRSGTLAVQGDVINF